MKYERFGRVVDRCESFIERRFAVALLLSDDFTFEPIDDGPWIARDALGVCLAQQLVVGAYRLDFALMHPDADLNIAVELDGWTFHEKSREQSDADRVRDNELLSAGWYASRYLSDRATRDARGCTQDAYRLLIGRTPTLRAPAPRPVALESADVRLPTSPSIAQAFAAAEGDDEREMGILRKALDDARARRGLKTGTGT